MFSLVEEKRLELATIAAAALSGGSSSSAPLHGEISTRQQATSISWSISIP
jgi:hypothetical protein